MKKLRPFIKNNTGFSLQEIVVTIIIIGVLASLALPSYKVVMRKILNQEAHTILLSIHEGQKDIFHETGAFTTTITDLDVIFPAPKSFNAPALHDANEDCHGVGSIHVLGSIEKVDPNGYTLYVTDPASIICCPTTATDTICETMGFDSPW